MGKRWFNPKTKLIGRDLRKNVGELRGTEKLKQQCELKKRCRAHNRRLVLAYAYKSKK